MAYQISLLDVFDNVLGEEDCTAILRAGPTTQRDLTERLRDHYAAWEPNTDLPGIYSGSWLAHNSEVPRNKETLLTDLLLFDRVVIHDPIEPYVSDTSRWVPPVGAPTLEDGTLAIALVRVPSQKSTEVAALTTALYPPHARWFGTVAEAYEFNRRDWLRLRSRLEFLESIRPLVKSGDLLLVPPVEATRRQTPEIARLGEASIARVGRALAAADEPPLTGFFALGATPTANWLPEWMSARANARHIAWVYARELSLAVAARALLAVQRDVDDAILDEMLGGGSVANGPLPSRAHLVRIPFNGLPTFAEVARLRRDVEAAAVLRHEFTGMLTTDVDQMYRDAGPAEVQRIVESRLKSLLREAEAVVARTPSVSERLLTFGLKMSQSILPAVAGLARGNQSPPRDRALIWLHRALS